MKQNNCNNFQNTKEVFERKLPFLLNRNKIISAIKSFFSDENFIEVDTPILQYSPGMEVHLSAFETMFNNINGIDKQKLYLHTSPEFSMKKLLSFGMKNIYQFTHTFRNEVVSPTHYPEFTMLEWYRVGYNYEKLMSDCEQILKRSLEIIGTDHFEYNGKKCFLNDGIEKLTIAQAFEKFCHFDILSTIDNPQNPSTKLITPFAKKLNINVSESDTWDDIYEKLMFEYIEPNLGDKKPTILYEYPIHQAALSAPKSDNPNIAERFELYICGVELANAFTELTNRKVQEERFLHDQAEKQKIYGTTFPIDYEFLNSIENLENCTGIAMGIDRLIMLANHTNNIKDVLWIEIPTLSEL
ncbi:MAG: EF-P lysine aminoacylase GenX [Alphaproteobacteria bacterium]|nr:EF-P lysine aminoacylase GenX [Alphaproteobacteria bacterium]